ncbi:hypothetical protein L6452_15875 [Arctium lappa]|uniref:Uncharacterized protein n=1 Tax=Arctium lappa TaxID=4217 RepID=A0ACB9CPY9_ARCLA|nr:hypothetical protein L6452_15875 [Arctium lappa]
MERKNRGKGGAVSNEAAFERRLAKLWIGEFKLFIGLEKFKRGKKVWEEQGKTEDEDKKRFWKSKVRDGRSFAEVLKGNDSSSKEAPQYRIRIAEEEDIMVDNKEVKIRVTEKDEFRPKWEGLVETSESVDSDSDVEYEIDGESEEDWEEETFDQVLDQLSKDEMGKGSSEKKEVDLRVWNAEVVAEDSCSAVVPENMVTEVPETEEKRDSGRVDYPNPERLTEVVSSFHEHAGEGGVCNDGRRYSEKEDSSFHEHAGEGGSYNDGRRYSEKEDVIKGKDPTDPSARSGSDLLLINILKKRVGPEVLGWDSLGFYRDQTLYGPDLGNINYNKCWKSFVGLDSSGHQGKQKGTIRNDFPEKSLINSLEVLECSNGRKAGHEGKNPFHKKESNNFKSKRISNLDSKSIQDTKDSKKRGRKKKSLVQGNSSANESCIMGAADSEIQRCNKRIMSSYSEEKNKDTKEERYRD